LGCHGGEGDYQYGSLHILSLPIAVMLLKCETNVVTKSFLRRSLLLHVALKHSPNEWAGKHSQALHTLLRTAVVLPPKKLQIGARE